MPEQDFAERPALRRRAEAARAWIARAAVFFGAASGDGSLRARALRRALVRSGDADPASVPGAVHALVRVDRARHAVGGHGLPAALCRREGRQHRHTDRGWSARDSAPRCCFPSTTRIRRVSPAPSAPSPRSSKRSARTPPSTSSSYPTRAAPRTAQPRRPPTPSSRRALAGQIAVYYRRRIENTARKSGNLKDWVERFGGAYEHFVILDGDSIMSGAIARAPCPRHGERPEGGPHPDRAAAHRRRDAAAAPDAVRLQYLWAAGRGRPRLLASRPGQLLGPQRHHPHGRVRGLGRLARTCRDGRRSAVIS